MSCLPFSNPIRKQAFISCLPSSNPRMQQSLLHMTEGRRQVLSHSWRHGWERSLTSIMCCASQVFISSMGRPFILEKKKFVGKTGRETGKTKGMGRHSIIEPFHATWIFQHIWMEIDFLAANRRSTTSLVVPHCQFSSECFGIKFRMPLL